MKKIQALPIFKDIRVAAIACLLLLLAAPAAVQAQSGSGSNFVYSINASNSSTITVTNYTGPAGTVVIPSTINGLTVTCIGDGVDDIFGAIALTNVTIPGSVTTISNSAFYACTSLQAVTIPASVTSIGNDAFYDCTSLLSVSIPNSVTNLGQYAFYECYDLTNLTIGTNITSIGQSVFQQCSSLQTLTIPNSVTNIGNSAFSECSDLTNFTIPYSVTNIGMYAFAYCYDLTSITIPSSATNFAGYVFYASGLTNVIIASGITSIVAEEFYECSSLQNITIPGTVTNIGQYAFDGSGLTNVVLSNGVTSIGPEAFYNCASLKTVTIPNTVTSIGVDAFAYCYDLTGVTIPNSVTNIGDSAFLDCSGMTNVTLSFGISFIGNSVFEDCTSLTNIMIGSNITSIGEEAFYDSGLTSVTIPSSVTNIGQEAFGDCTGLTNFTFQNNITSIAEYAFYDCTSLTSITIPSSVTSIEDYAFYGCTKLTNVTMFTSVTSIGNYVFQYCTSLTNFTMPNSVTSIGDDLFANCSALTNVTISTNIGNIGYAMFYDCTSLTNVSIPNSSSSIGYQAFYGCAGLTNVTIGTNVSSIGQYAFQNCTSLPSITIGTNVSSIGYAAFIGCTSLTAINVTPGNPDYISFGGILFNQNQTMLITYPPGKAGASYTIPTNVITIEDYAFQTCTNLSNVMIGTNVTSIGQYSFQSCTSLTGVTIPNSVTSIEYEAFYSCTGLTNVTIGSGVTSIAEYAFSDCTSLTNIYFLGNAPTGDSTVFSSDNNATVYYSPYTTGWGYTFGGISTEVEAQLEFTWTTNAGTLTIISYIGPGGAVTIPTNINGLPVTRIGTNAFAGVTNLTSLRIAGSVTNIGDDAFEGCINLVAVYFQGNAPTADSTVFAGDNNVLVDYLPGTTGWGPTFAGRPAEALISFDDLPINDSGGTIPANYENLTWNNFEYLDGLAYGDGYAAGVVSAPNVIYNAYGNPANISSSVPFTLTSAYLTAAWNDNLQVEVIGYYSNNVILYSNTYILSAVVPTLIVFNYTNITEANFISSGGTPHPAYGESSAYQFAMDNLVINGTGESTPTVQYNANPTSGPVPLTVNFTSPSSDTAGNAISNWNWRFGDGAISTNQNPSHQYTVIGAYSPSLTVTNTNDLAITATGPSTITVTSPTVQYNANPTSGTAPLTVNFTSPGSDSAGNAISNWNWSFGDGAISTNQNPSHQYTVIGTFFPTLTVTNTNNLSIVATGPSSITVTEPPFDVVITAPTNGASFANNQSFAFSAVADSPIGIKTLSLYLNSGLITSVASSNISTNLSDLPRGSYQLTAVAMDNNNSVTSTTVFVTVNTPGTTWIDFDPLTNSLSGPVTGTALSAYLAQYGVSVTNNSLPGTAVAVENQADVAHGDSVLASSQPNLLTQIGSNGPVSFTVGFASPLTQFNFTRPELLANPTVSHPAFQVQAFDSLGVLLASTNAPQISSSTNVPAQTYTLTGAGIASVEFNSEGSGLTTFNAMLLDDFILTPGTAANLPPSVLIASPTNGRVFTSLSELPFNVEAAPGSGTVTRVIFYDGTTPLGTNFSSPYSILWDAPSNGTYTLSAVAVNNSGLSRTSAPVSITVVSGFAITTPPLSQTIGVGQTAVFNVATTGTNTTYQWRFNGSNLFGATSSSYAISNALISAAGSYTVVVTSGGLSITSPPAVLTVLGPPTLGSPSQTTITNNGNINITLSLNVSDAVPFYSQWQLNGNGIAGATNSNPAGTNVPISFTISNARPFNSGNYQVVVANAVASQESPSFNVVVSVGTPVTTNNNFNSSLAFNPLAPPNAVAGINSSSSFPPVDGPALIAGKPAAGFLWYDWTASFSGVISLTTRGSSFDTLMGVYTGNTLASLKQVMVDDDSGGFFTSLVTFNCIQGITYHIAVAGYQGATGYEVLQLSPGPPQFPGPVGGYSTNEAYPVITQEPVSQIVPAGSTVTNRVTASNATSYQWFFAGAPVAVGTASSLVISNFPATAAGQYYAQVANAVGSVFSTIAGVQIAAGNPSTNLLVDKFGDAADLTGAIVPDHFVRPEDDTGGFNLSQTFSTVGATKEVGEPNHAGQPGGASYWYTFSATGNGTVKFDTSGSAFNTILAIYKNKNVGAAADFSSLTNVGSGYTTNYVQQGQPVVVVSNVVNNTKFYIAVDGYQGASGAARLNVTLTPPALTTNVVPVTNNQAVVAFTSPVNNSLTFSSNITVKIKGSGGKSLATSLQVTLNGNAPVTLSTFTLVKPTTQDWTLTNVLLQPGPNVLTAQSIDVQSATQETASLPATCTVFYDATAPSPSITSHLTLLTTGSGSGTITGEANHASLEVGKIYKVKAVPAGNSVFDSWAGGTNTNSLSLLSDSATLSFDMFTNLILQATFVINPFTAVAGTYNGLFAPLDGVTEASSGFLTATLPANGHGAYSAKLLLDGGSNSFSGAFDLTGTAQATVTRPGKPPLAVTLQLNLTAPDGQLIGSVNNFETNNGWTSILQGYRAAHGAQSSPATNYTLIIPPGPGAPASQPGGYGYLTLANKAGAIELSGHLADGAPLSQSVAVSADGAIPLYVSLYAGKGSLQGWLTLADLPPPTVLGAGLAWIKPPGRTGTPYAAGFTNTEITVQGSLYVPPVAHADALTLSNATLTISNGTVNVTYTNVAIKGDNLVNNGTNIGTITPGTGLLTVKLPHDDGGQAKGVLLQNSAPTNAAGWFLNTNQSGFFLLEQ